MHSTYAPANKSIMIRWCCLLITPLSGWSADFVWAHNESSFRNERTFVSIKSSVLWKAIIFWTGLMASQHSILWFEKWRQFVILWYGLIDIGTNHRSTLTVNSSKLHDRTTFSLLLTSLLIPNGLVHFAFFIKDLNVCVKFSIWFYEKKKHQTVRPHRSRVIANIKNQRSNRRMMSRFHFLMS